MPRTSRRSPSADKRPMVALGAPRVLALVALSSIVLFAAASFQSVAVRTSEMSAVIASVLVELVNGDRAQGNESALSVSPLLTRAAEAKARDMAEKGYFAHVSPDGTEPWEWIAAAGYEYSMAGENLAMDFSDSADVERAWMNSPTHRTNIMNERFTEIGIGTEVGMFQGRETVFAVQMFGTPRERAPLAVAPKVIAPQTIPQAPESDTIAPILGEASDAESDAIPAVQPQSPGRTENIVRKLGELEESITENASLADHMLGSPRTALRYSLMALAALIILGLGIVTGYEIEKHHMKHVAACISLLLLIVGLYMVGGSAVFTEPVLSEAAASRSVAQ